jgi:hypothetical protein
MNAGVLLSLSNANLYMIWGTIGSLGLSILIFLTYHIRLALVSDYKGKYDFINRNEIRHYMICGYLIVIAGWFFLNSLFSEKEQTDIGILVARLLGTLIFASIFMVVIHNVLKIYYPAAVEKKLNKWRYKPRKSPKTGKDMTLLSEEEEDVYLTEGMQAEETAFSVDYDVWIDKESGYTSIEKYEGHLHNEKCDNCGFQTLKIYKEEVVASPSEHAKGELIKYYECTYCGHKTSKGFSVGRMKEVENLENPA